MTDIARNLSPSKTQMCMFMLLWLVFWFQDKYEFLMKQLVLLNNIGFIFFLLGKLYLIEIQYRTRKQIIHVTNFKFDTL